MRVFDCSLIIMEHANSPEEAAAMFRDDIAEVLDAIYVLNVSDVTRKQRYVVTINDELTAEPIEPYLVQDLDIWKTEVEEEPE